ncbi:disulfide bond formation protein DsbA [Flavobacterium sp. LM5]|uniref:DsbA family oxidoreductase n=1 Tax=Flavobacterium sp. LM5 TaxID=1938610 RepID=UPI000993BB3F|nr:DsbA family oxidoreductase [Flavobacterium sp. LM5]OOV28505.1 disulfide bond formation protein DsbA [Flavobacterium sp. LM5]
MTKPINIQIWSDIMCPFCYIGKRRLESAIAQFEYKNAVTIEWKSFQLDANFVATKEDSLVEHLAEKYRKDTDWAQQMLDDMTQNAKNVGLDFHFEKAKMANSYNAHRLLHLAKEKEVADSLKELLFKAYLTDGLDINNIAVLTSLGKEVGLEEKSIHSVFSSDRFGDAVRKDQLEAQAIGVQGVPFFVLNNKYAVSGAQYPETFLNALKQIWEEVENTSINKEADNSCCGIDGCN